jgi:ribosomal protein S18 acetylase RimI-like enzyme
LRLSRRACFKTGMSDAIFRRATSADLPAIVKLLASDVLGRTREDDRDPPNPKYLAAFAAIEADGNQLLAVAVRDAAVVGCLQISFVPGLSKVGMWRGQIESVRVSADHRGGGLGDRGMPRPRMRHRTINDRQKPPRRATLLRIAWVRGEP